MSTMEDQEITAVRDMTDEEYDRMYWPVDNMGRATVIEVDDGTRLFPSCDTEGNRAGFFFGMPTESSDIVGATIEAVRPMEDDELKQHGWPVGNPHLPAPPVVELSTGDSIYPSSDGEGNSPGALFGFAADEDETFMILFQEN